MDMIFHWVRDRVKQDHYQVIWKKGEDNLGDYFTKHHPATHHRKMRPLYLVNLCQETLPGEGVLIYDPEAAG